MDTIQIKEELHQFIEQADARVLNLIYGMMRADSNLEILTAEQQEDLDQRIASHKNGESKSFSWAEAKAQIMKGA